MVALSYADQAASGSAGGSAASQQRRRRLALKVRLPFCRQACRFCASRRVPSRDSRQAEPYLSRLDREMVLARRRLAGLPAVTRLHWGGGAPAFLALDQMSDLFDRVLGENTQVELHLPPTSPTARVDPAQLEQVLLNLAVNALEAMGPDGGVLEIEP